MIPEILRLEVHSNQCPTLDARSCGDPAKGVTHNPLCPDFASGASIPMDDSLLFFRIFT